MKKIILIILLTIVIPGCTVTSSNKSTHDEHINRENDIIKIKLFEV